MKTRLLHLLSLAFVLLASMSLLQAQTGSTTEAKIMVEVDKPGSAISPDLFGIFFEDINLSTDGGMYPEMVRNRSFEDADSLQYWKFVSTDGKSMASICNADAQARPPLPPLTPFNLKSLRVKAAGSFTLENDGYWGMNIVEGQRYTFSVAARSTDGFNSPLHVRIVTSEGKELTSSEVKTFDDTWKYFSTTLTATGGDPKAHMEISGDGNGTLYLDMVSLMPDTSWKNHGLRVDLSEALDALHPRFMRFPGGSWVDGGDVARIYRWKNTIGSIDERTPLWNLWGYNSTNSIGYHEYLQLAEDLGAEPLFCINAGISFRDVIPLDQMGQWVQDALDAIEYANGPVNSVWGSLRAKNGHPGSFNLKYVEIGNENGQEPYAERWALMASAIRAKYPDVKLIANEWAGSHPHEPAPEIVDEHYYDNPDWFMWNANKYDSYDRKGPKIFIGEYAVTENTGKGNLRGAIGEAAWMTGMERNSDIVAMGSYAPLFCNANHKAWPVNLINFDSYRWFGLPSYYVQQMFANNQGTVSLPVKVEKAPTLQSPSLSGCIGLGTWNNSAEFKDVKVVSADGKVLFQSDFSGTIDNWKKVGRGEWSVQNGVLRQSAIAPFVTAFVGDTTWTDYTITLKARKLAGENGFQIYFHHLKNNDRLRWDLGGYTNSVDLLEIGVTSVTKSATIETGRWYDVKIELRGNSAKGYLDGKIVQEVGDVRTSVKSLFASAARDDKSGDIIVKVVNASFDPLTTQIELKGAGAIGGKGKAIVLASGSPLDENTLDDPTKVVPKTELVHFSGNILTRSFPGNSLTVIRLANSDGKK
ncbi:MAG: alpha-L-arabinofuranosidase C-terminal domain-containing protein [Bacteroidota bacterium]